MQKLKNSFGSKGSKGGEPVLVCAFQVISCSSLLYTGIMHRGTHLFPAKAKEELLYYFFPRYLPIPQYFQSLSAYKSIFPQ